MESSRESDAAFPAAQWKKKKRNRSQQGIAGEKSERNPVRQQNSQPASQAGWFEDVAQRVI
jgi:hypothetical protein